MTLRTVVYVCAALAAAVPAAAQTSGAGTSFAPPPIGASVYQGAASAVVRYPRRVAATAAGDLFVIDGDGALHRLTRRGDRVGMAIEGAVAIAGGPNLVYVSVRGGAVVGVNALTASVVSRFQVGGEAPVGLAYDAPRGLLWLAYRAGVLEARRPDGALVRRITATPAGSLGVVVDVAVSPGGVVWIAQQGALQHEGDPFGGGEVTGPDPGYLHAFDAATGAFLRSVGQAVTGQARIVGGIAATPGRLYVADLFSGNVRVLDESGATLEVLGRRGADVDALASGELVRPSSVSLMENGDVLVANSAAHRLERFGTGRAFTECRAAGRLDSDCDGMPDDWELANGLDPFDPRDAYLVARAGDGLRNGVKYAYGLDPAKTDSDGDGYSDANEIASGYDPRDREDHWPVMLVDAPSVSDPGFIELVGSVNDRGNLGGCSVRWRQATGPVVKLEPAALSQAFVARRGTYRFEATATCAGVSGRRTVVDLAIRNVAPRAEVVGTVAQRPGTIQLRADTSSDANGDKLTFAWDQAVGTPIAGATTGASLTAVANAPGYYGFRLGVTDPSGAEGVTEFPVVVVDDDGAPTAIVAREVVARAGEVVVLDASASHRSYSATFLWEQLAGLPVELDAASSDAPWFTVPAPGRYTFQVSVLDGAFRSPPALVEIFAAPAGGVLPTAIAQAPALAVVNAPLSLDGGASSAGTGAALSYAWRQVSGPAAGLTRADRASAKVVPFSPGSYEFELVVTDGAASSVPARVRFEARDRDVPIPVAVARAQPNAVVGEIVALDDSGSDARLNRRWTQVEGPWVPIGSRPAWFKPVAPGVYGFELVVDDGQVRSAPSRVNVIVLAD